MNFWGKPNLRTSLHNPSRFLEGNVLVKLKKAHWSTIHPDSRNITLWFVGNPLATGKRQFKRALVMTFPAADNREISQDLSQSESFFLVMVKIAAFLRGPVISPLQLWQECGLKLHWLILGVPEGYQLLTGPSYFSNWYTAFLISYLDSAVVARLTWIGCCAMMSKLITSTTVMIDVINVFPHERENWKTLITTFRGWSPTSRRLVQHYSDFPWPTLYP